MTEKAKQLH